MKRNVLIALTAMSIGRAMTLAFVARAGDGGPGDPPDAWLMPLLGDAAVGLVAIGVTAALIRSRSLATWTFAEAFHAIAAFDAVAAMLVDIAEPWPDFFMLELFGRPMFVAAGAMHVVAVVLLWQEDVRRHYRVATSGVAPAA